MAFYDLDKDKRAALVITIREELLSEIKSGERRHILSYFSDEDTYIRKAAYLGMGKIWQQYPALQRQQLQLLAELMENGTEQIRQTAINAAGEIGKTHFETVQHFFDMGLLDAYHIVRNAVIGSMKKMGEVNPVPVLDWARQYLYHPDKEIRREICHGIELRGRKFPQEILPLLKELEHDTTARVRNTLVHVLGQIAYKKGCLETVVDHLKTWENKALVTAALEEIIDVHHRYRNFTVKTQEQAIQYINKHYHLQT